MPATPPPPHIPTRPALSRTNRSIVILSTMITLTSRSEYSDSDGIIFHSSPSFEPKPEPGIGTGNGSNFASVTGTWTGTGTGGSLAPLNQIRDLVIGIARGSGRERCLSRIEIGRRTFESRLGLGRGRWREEVEDADESSRSRVTCRRGETSTPMTDGQLERGY